MGRSTIGRPRRGRPEGSDPGWVSTPPSRSPPQNSAMTQPRLPGRASRPVPRLPRTIDHPTNRNRAMQSTEPPTRSRSPTNLPDRPGCRVDRASASEPRASRLRDDCPVASRFGRAPRSAPARGAPSSCARCPPGHRGAGAGRFATSSVPSSASTRSCMICSPIPRSVSAGVEPRPRSATSNVIVAADREPHRRAARSPAWRTTFCSACRQQKYTQASRPVVEPQVREAGSASIVARTPILRMWASSAATMPLSASSGGKMPRARSRSPSSVAFARSAECGRGSLGAGVGRSRATPAAISPSVSRSLPDVALQPATLRVAGGHQPLPRGPQLVGLDVELLEPVSSSSVSRTLCSARPACAPRSCSSASSAGSSGSPGDFVTAISRSARPGDGTVDRPGRHRGRRVGGPASRPARPRPAGTAGRGRRRAHARAAASAICGSARRPTSVPAIRWENSAITSYGVARRPYTSRFATRCTRRRTGWNASATTAVAAICSPARSSPRPEQRRRSRRRCPRTRA